MCYKKESDILIEKLEEAFEKNHKLTISNKWIDSEDYHLLKEITVEKINKDTKTVTFRLNNGLLREYPITHIEIITQE